MFGYSSVIICSVIEPFCLFLYVFSCRYENAFLISLVGLRPEKYFWTGLSNTEDRTTFQWTTKEKVAFTNFNVGMPGKTRISLAVYRIFQTTLWHYYGSCISQKICYKEEKDELHWSINHIYFFLKNPTMNNVMPLGVNLCVHRGWMQHFFCWAPAVCPEVLSIDFVCSDKPGHVPLPGIAGQVFSVWHPLIFVS